MNRNEIREAVLRDLHRIAPEADLATLDPDADLRDALDIDSMDFLNFMVALDRDVHVGVPESDYERVTTLRRCLDYLAARLEAH
jgi:acyl carrier protein